RTVAFSRSSRPSVPISWLSESSTSPPRLDRTISAASSSCSAETEENTLVIATPSIEPGKESRKRRSSCAPNGTISQPLNSLPPGTIASPAEIVCRRSTGQASSGRIASVEGAPIRMTTTRHSLLRWRTAFVACVVPNMTWLIRERSSPAAASTPSSAATMPPVMSGRVATFAFASSRPARSRSTASVFVPPTSMPRRRSSCRCMQLLHRLVVEVVAEHAWPRHRESAVAPPDRMAGECDHADALPVSEALGGDRCARLVVEHGDDVGDRGEDASLLERDEVLVLDLESQRAASVGAESLDERRPAGKPARRPPLDVDDLAPNEPEAGELVHQLGHRIGLGGAQQRTDPPCERDRAGNRCRPRLLHRQDVHGH